MNLGDDWFLTSVTQTRRNWQLALYVIHLSTGHNLWSRTLKVDTILNYLRDVARFLNRFFPVDPRYARAGDKEFAPCIQSLIQELRRWETVPNKQEPYTVQMQLVLESLATGRSQDSLLPAFGR